MLAERRRIEEASRREKHWRRWGPYLSERSWGTVREDYSPYGSAWEYFSHDHSRSRAYRWTEDGLCGICDNHQRLCFALALWNGRDPFLKERLYGLTGNEGNHSEDVKEYYYYLDSTPTHSYMKCLYKYPQAAYPYAQLLEESRRRTRRMPEFELIDTGLFDDNRYFDVFVEYAKADADDILIRITVHNRGPERALLHVLPTVWFRNTWSWFPGKKKPVMQRAGQTSVAIEEESLGRYHCWFDTPREILFTENESNIERLWNYPNGQRHFKDAFHDYVVGGRRDAVNPLGSGTKACGLYVLDVPAAGSSVISLRLTKGESAGDFDQIFSSRKQEADEFYDSFIPRNLSEDARAVERQAFAGLLWSKQYYHYVIEQWLAGDPAGPPPPLERKHGRNHSWVHLFNEDVLSMPDKWEYPWYAAWDLAFHMIPQALVDPDSAKSQLALMLREWYMHPNGQIPAYEWAFDDVNPPVHAWACWRVYQIDRRLTGVADNAFLERVFHKLLMNFTWWVNRKDSEGNNIFEGGFLGLDNIGVFDRSAPLPIGGSMEQSDATSWMAMYCLNMLKIALELSNTDSTYEDIASKFFEHFLYIAAAMNGQGAGGLWDDDDGFYYDRLRMPNNETIPLKVRSLVGLIPMFAVDTLEPALLAGQSGFRRRMEWFITNRPDLCRNLHSMTREGVGERRLLAIVRKDRLTRIIQTMFDENEFLSPYGIRSVSRYHKDHPYVLHCNGSEYRVDYEPAESSTFLFGGNSNWRGPVWFPVNYLLIESLQRFNHYYGDSLKVEFPTGSGRFMNLGDAAAELSRRLARLFLKDGSGRRPVFGDCDKFQTDPHFRDHIPFYEYFHGDTGKGFGASHQTGWTALVAKLIQQNGA